MSKFEQLDAFVETTSNATPKIETLKNFAEYISKMGYTGMFLGSMDYYKIEGEPYFGYQRGGYTKEEIRELDEYCKSVNIELKPSIQVLGHLYFLGKYATYRDYMDNNEVLLVDDERTYVLIDKMFKTVSEYFTSRNIHIGMDEAFGLGMGKHLERYGYENGFDIITRHLSRVLEIAKKYGFRCEMWSDMFIHHLISEEEFQKSKAEIRKQVEGKIPSEVTLSHWSYINLDEKKLTDELAKHDKLTDRVSFTGAVLKWFGFAPDLAYSCKAIRHSMSICYRTGIRKYNVALWGDWGAEASIFSALPALYFASEYNQGRCESVADLDREKFKRLFGVDFDTFMLLDLPNKPHPNVVYDKPNSKCVFYLYSDPLLGQMDALLSENTGRDYARAAEILAQAEFGAFKYISDTLSKLCQALSLKAELGKRIKGYYDLDDKRALKEIAEKDIPQLIEYVREFYDDFYKQWTVENKTFGFETQSQRIGGLIFRLEHVARVLKAYCDGTVSEIQELNAERLVPDIVTHKPTEDNYIMFGWNHIVANGWI